MRLSIIAAIGLNNEIGKDNQLLWHISSDLKRFKKLTTGHTIVMGRKTFESLKNGPLPNRRNIVLTRNSQFDFADVEVIHDVDELKNIVGSEEEVFIIGGEDIFKQFLPFTDYLYLTLVNGNFDADAYFPAFNKCEWKEIERTTVTDDIQAGIEYSFVTFERKKNLNIN